MRNVANPSLELPTLADDACEYFVANLNGAAEISFNNSIGTGKAYLLLNDNISSVGSAGKMNPLKHSYH